MNAYPHFCQKSFGSRLEVDHVTVCNNIENGDKLDFHEWSEDAARQSIMFWCIITENNELLHYFWTKSRNPLMTALVIASIYLSLSEIQQKLGDRDTVEEFQTEYRKYERYAVDIFRLAHDNDWKFTESLLLHSHKEYHNFSIIEMAG